MTFYESIANQGTQTLAVRMFIETSGECAMHFDSNFDWEAAKCVLFNRFGEKGAQMFKKIYSLYSAFCTQPAFYSQSAVCILPLVRSLRFTLTGTACTTKYMPLNEKHIQCETN